MSKIENVNASLHKILTTGSITKLANRLFIIMNKDIANHNERTAYIAMKIAQHHRLNKKCTMQNLVFLCLFHTIGFFREDFSYATTPNNDELDFFSQEKSIMSKYIFSCYYLEYMTPLKVDARALENFNQPYDKDLKKYIYQEEYKSVIYLSARISDYINKNPDKPLPKNLNDLAPGFFDPEYVQAFNEANKDNEIVNKIKDKSFKPELFTYVTKIDYPIEDHIKMVKLLIYLLDFKSTFTMKHSINTSCYAVCLGIRLKLTSTQLIDLFISAYLHDVGKIAIPPRILESPNRLTKEERKIMQSHVVFSKRILQGIVKDEIVENVYRHHEKLNGTGYPNHIQGKDLTLTQRILTVADITSALNDSRSYKEEYTKEHVLNIIQEMTDTGELDPNITKIMINDFDGIQKELRYLQELLSVDFSNVIQKYNDYVFNDTDAYTTLIMAQVQDESKKSKKDDYDDFIENIEDFEELDDIEDLDEIEELKKDTNIDELDEEEALEEFQELELL